MGSLPGKLAIPPAEIVARYLGGEGSGMLALRARTPVYRITEILTQAGVRIRGPAEAIRLSIPARSDRIKRQRRG